MNQHDDVVLNDREIVDEVLVTKRCVVPLAKMEKNVELLTRDLDRTTY